MFTITAANADDQRLYKEYLQFQALPAVQLSFSQQNIEDTLFVEASVQNVTCEPTLPISVDVVFVPRPVFKCHSLVQSKGKVKAGSSLHMAMF